jgi:hypothetical protein
VGTSAGPGPTYTIEAHQAKRQQGLEIPVRPQEGQVVEVNGGAGFVNGVMG